MYLIDDYKYELPENLIAHIPDKKRDDCRLLCLDRNSGSIKHKNFKDLGDLLLPSDLLVVNNTRVVPARIYGKKDTGGKVEILIIDYQGGLESYYNDGVFRCECLVKSSKRPHENSVLTFEGGLKAKVCNFEKGIYILEFSSEEDILTTIENVGCMPLPPYIKRNEHAFLNDRQAYQTVYAADKGAVAAPTAGLHFTDSLMADIKARGVEIAELTLHVGYGTFVPVRVKDIREHQIHKERFSITQKAAEQINQAKKDKRRIIAVGTTSVRTLEYNFKHFGKMMEGKGACDLFIYPGYKFEAVDAVITNFHIPESTLLMLVSAFAGREKILETYEKAKEERYRFFSYGDAMLIT